MQEAFNTRPTSSRFPESESRMKWQDRGRLSSSCMAAYLTDECGTANSHSSLGPIACFVTICAVPDKVETTPTAEPFTHHEDLRQFLKALDIHRVLLVGLSNYAIALDFTIAYPELVEKLVLVSPGLLGYDFRDPWVGTSFAAMMDALGRQDLNRAIEVFLTMWVDGPYRKPAEVNPVVREQAREMVTRSCSLSRLAPNCRGLEPQAVGRLSEVLVPTLVVLGQKDAPDIHAIGKLIHEGIVGSQEVTINNVGHALPMERPNEFNRTVESFLLY